MVGLQHARKVARRVPSDERIPGEGSESRKRPTQPKPLEFCGSPVDQMSVPWKCDRLWFWYPVRWMIARLPRSKICFRPVSRGCRPSRLPPASVPIGITFARGTFTFGRRV